MSVQALSSSVHRASSNHHNSTASCGCSPVTALCSSQKEVLKSGHFCSFAYAKFCDSTDLWFPWHQTGYCRLVRCCLLWTDSSAFGVSPVADGWGRPHHWNTRRTVSRWTGRLEVAVCSVKRPCRCSPTDMRSLLYRHWQRWPRNSAGCDVTCLTGALIFLVITWRSPSLHADSTATAQLWLHASNMGVWLKTERQLRYILLPAVICCATSTPFMGV